MAEILDARDDVVLQVQDLQVAAVALLQRGDQALVVLGALAHQLHRDLGHNTAGITGTQSGVGVKKRVCAWAEEEPTIPRTICASPRKSRGRPALAAWGLKLQRVMSSVPRLAAPACSSRKIWRRGHDDVAPPQWQRALSGLCGASEGTGRAGYSSKSESQGCATA
eukprot:scaffold1340_cov253-Pinguiococcus_pyrenoidosus.AAC.37